MPLASPNASDSPLRLLRLQNLVLIASPMCTVITLTLDEQHYLHSFSPFTSPAADPATCQQSAPHVQVVMSTAPAGTTVEYSTPGILAIVHPV